MYTVYLDKQLIHDLDSEENVLVNPTLELELNKAGTFTFSMECTHPYYDKPERFKSIIQVLCDGDEIFKGRIIEITDDMYKERTVYCESELAYLNDTIQRPYEYHLAASAVYEYLQAVIGSHNGQVDDSRQFTLGEITVNDPNDYIYCYTNYNTTMDEIKEDLVDDLGGYIRIRNDYKNSDPLGELNVTSTSNGRYIDYINLEEYGKTSEQRIEFGENLLDFTNDINQADICTGIIPLGATLEESQYSAIDERVTIESVNGGSDYLVISDAVAKYGLILKVVTWDDITEPSNLKTAAENYLAEYDYEPQTITATAVDMHLTDEEIESWRLGDKIFVESEPHDLHKRFPLAQMSIPLDQPENTSVTLGTYEDTSLSGRNNKTEAGLRNFENFEIGNVIASAVARATAIIDQHTNGYVTIHYDEDRGCADEILIMDAPNTEDATRVWRWNLNGLGYSSTGYSGDDAAYGTAITMDGWILGNFIIANGMILADDNDATFGKFNDQGMQIYAQAGKSDLLLMSIGQDGMELYDDSGKEILATFYSDGVTTYGQETGTVSNNSRQLTVAAHSEGTLYPFSNATQREWLRITSCTVQPASTSQLGLSYSYTYGVDSTGPYITITNNSDEEIRFNQNTVVEYLVNSYMAMRLNGTSLHFYDETGADRTRINSSRFSHYFSDGTPAMAIDTNGFRTYFENGSREVVIDHDQGLRIFSNSDVERMRLNANGYYIYSDDGTTRMGLSLNGLYYYDSSGDPVTEITTNGVDYYRNGSYVGSVGTAGWYQRENDRGMRLHLDPSSAYLAFDWKESESAEYSTAMFYVLTDNSGVGETGSHFSADVYLDNWNLYLSDSSYFLSYTNGGGFKGGNFWFDGDVYSNNIKLTTLADTAYVMLTANGEEAEGELSFYSGMKLDVSDLVDYKSSDETLKTSIEPISDARVDNITPVTFKWRDGDNTAHYGYIAQEVREHIPEIVKENDDGLLSLAYTEIIPLLHAKINTLEDRIAKLEAIIYGKEKN